MNRRNFIKNTVLNSFLSLSSPIYGESWNISTTKKPSNRINYNTAVLQITGSNEFIPYSKKIHLTVPKVSENWASIPIKVSVDSLSYHVKEIHILTENSNSRTIMPIKTYNQDLAHV